MPYLVSYDYKLDKNDLIGSDEQFFVCFVMAKKATQFLMNDMFFSIDACVFKRESSCS